MCEHPTSAKFTHRYSLLPNALEPYFPIRKSINTKSNMEHEWITKRQFTEIYIVCPPKTPHSALRKSAQPTGQSSGLKSLGLLGKYFCKVPWRNELLVEETSSTVRCLMGVKKSFLHKFHKFVRSTIGQTQVKQCASLYRS